MILSILASLIYFGDCQQAQETELEKQKEIV